MSVQSERNQSVIPPVTFINKHSTRGPLPTLSVVQAINEAAQLFLKADSWEYAANEVLTSIGRVFNISRISILKKTTTANHDPLAMRCIYEWADEGVTKVLGQIAPRTIMEEKVYEAWIHELNQGKTIKRNISSTEKLEKAYLDTIHVQSMVACPLMVRQTLWGSLLFEECRHDRPWSEGNLETMNMVATLFASAIEGGLMVQQLKETESRFQIVSRATNDSVYDWDMQADTIWRSPNTEMIFGYRMTEINGNAQWWQKHIHPADKSRVLDELINLNRSGNGFWSSEYRFRHASGQYMHILDRAYVAYDTNNEPKRLIGSMLDITKVKKNEIELELSRDRLRRLALHSQMIREEERKHLSRELHDEFAQILTGIKYNLEWLKSKVTNENADIMECVTETSEVVSNTMEKVKEIAMALRPSIIDDVGLLEAIKWQLSKFQDMSCCRCVLENQIDDLKMDNESEIAIFRILQESLANVARHAKADLVEITLQQHEQELILQVKDNGIGIPEFLIDSADSIGLLGMRERASAIGGTLDIHRLTHGGTAVVLKVSLQAPKPHMDLRLKLKEQQH